MILCGMLDLCRLILAIVIDLSFPKIPSGHIGDGTKVTRPLHSPTGRRRRATVVCLMWNRRWTRFSVHTGNMTGMSLQLGSSAGKRIEILRELVPGLRRLGILYGRPNFEISEIVKIARSLGIEVTKFLIRRSDDIAPAFETIKNNVDALYVSSHPLIGIHRHRVAELALAAQLPTMHTNRLHVDAGGLAFYGADYVDLFRRSADMVDKILRGAKPADIPVEQPTSLVLAINLRTAKNLGLKVPPTLIARADEVIE